MSDDKPSFFARVFLAWVAYFRTLFDAEFAASVSRLRAGAALPAPAEEKREEKPPQPKLEEAPPAAALQLLGLLQREGRFVDFLHEDVSGFSDEEIGGAARVVHEGCKKALHEHFDVAPIREEDEGAEIAVKKGYDAQAIRLTGKVVGEPPHRGELVHRGWRVSAVRLPKMSEGHDPRILAPAEVEL